MKSKTISTSLLFILFLSISVLAQEKLIVLKNTSFVDVEKGILIDNVDIVINESLIQSIEKHSPDVQYPEAQIIDLNGCYVIPGLIEGHTHISPIPEICLTLALKHGVTALRDMAGDGEYLKLLQDAVKSGELIGPDIYFSALMGGRDLIEKDSRIKISTPSKYKLGEAPWMRLVDENSNIPQIIQDAKNCGATGIKIYAHLPYEIVNKLTIEAKNQGLKVWAHWMVYPATPEDIIQSEVEVVSHVYFLLTPPNWNYKDGSKVLSTSYFDLDRYKKMFSEMRTKNIILDPTIVVSREMFSSVADKQWVKELNDSFYEIVKAAYNDGVKISAGTDIYLPKDENKKLPLHDEIEALVSKAGLSPIDALRAATIINAEVLGINNTQGSIKVGKLANLVVLTDNPLININNIEKVKFVLKNGIIIN